MAAGREIHPSIVYSATLAALPSDFERWLFILLHAQTDDWGRLHGELQTVMKRCIPEEPRRTPEVVEGGLQALHQVRRIQLYRAPDGGRCIQIVDFDAWNKRAVAIRKGRSRFPDPPGLCHDVITTRSRRDHDETAGLAREPGRAAMGVGSDVALASKERLFSFPESLKDREGGVGGGTQVEIPGVPLADVEHVYRHWRLTLGKTDARYQEISPNRFRTVALRLREFSAAQLCTAIDAVQQDPWADRQHHNDLTTIFATREAVDRWLDRATGGAPPPFDDGLQAYVRA